MARLGPRHFHRQGISELVLEAPRACCNRSKFGWPVAAQVPYRRGWDSALEWGEQSPLPKTSLGGCSSAPGQAPAIELSRITAIAPAPGVGRGGAGCCLQNQH